jgi:hypothetical protein
VSAPVANFRYVGPITRRDLPARIVDEWENTLKGARTRILVSLARFLDPATGLTRYLDQIAGASSDAWEAFINPNYPNADLIKMKQRVKLSSAYPSWSQNIQAALQEGGRFEQGVTANKSKFATNVKPTIGAVGFKPDLSWGPATKAALVVTGDRRVTRYITSPEEFSGAPANMFPISGKFVRPQIISAITFGAVMGIYALDINATSLLNAALNYTNSILNNVRAMARTCAEGGSFILELRHDDVRGLHVITQAVNC